MCVCGATWGPHGRPIIGIENGEARWHGSAGRVGRQGTGGNRKNAERKGCPYQSPNQPIFRLACG